MEELQMITEKYQPELIGESFSSLEGVTKFALTFYKDVAEIYDCLTRLKNVERNPTGFSIDDAPALGLLVRVWKLLKEVIRYYEQDNAEIIALFERPIIEASTIAKYLLKSEAEVMLDYRKCSYKDRLRIMRDLEGGSPFFRDESWEALAQIGPRKVGYRRLRKGRFQGTEGQPLEATGQKLL